MRRLDSNNPKTVLLRQTGVTTWQEAVEYIRMLPYGRNTDRSRFELVIAEERGSCSSKHALLKQVAIENGFENIKLILSMYKMNQENTPGIGNHITEGGLNYIPEAHCYLMIDSQRVDVTSTTSDIARIKNYILEEKEIQPHQVVAEKVEMHKSFLKKWMTDESVKLSFEEVWAVREKCIASLSG